MKNAPSPTYEVKCPKCGAEPGHRCTQRGFSLWRAHRQRIFEAERQNGGLIAAYVQPEAAGEAVLPRRVKCPSCGALAGEACMRTSVSTPDGWEYCTPDPAIRKHKYCTSRWAVAKGEAEYDIDESAAETGLWAGDAESAADNGLLAEVIDENAPGEPAMTPRQRIEELVANRARDAEEQARRRKVLNWGAQKGDA